MVKNTNEYQKEYMKKYIENSEDVLCPCCNKTYKSYRKYKHMITKKHINNAAKHNGALPQITLHDILNSCKMKPENRRIISNMIDEIQADRAAQVVA